jgi:argininosuccinate lyase
MSTIKPLWAKDDTEVDAQLQAFCAGDDAATDRAIFAADIEASIAHVHGLARIHVLTNDEAARLDSTLQELSHRYRAGDFVLDERYEDGHTAIETFLVQRCGELGKKVHTGRSRNDQVLVALRLVQKRQVESLRGLVLQAVDALLARAHEPGLVMPGYTHLQRAMPTSTQVFFAGHAESFLSSCSALQASMHMLDASPLGTGSGFGVNLALDRDGVASSLGFADVVLTGQAAQNSRGTHELFALAAMEQVACAVRRMAWDLSFFSTQECGFVVLPKAFTTGSSLMPNKRNPDVVELLRTLPATVEGARAELSSLLSLPSGYQRDLQQTKAPWFRAMTRMLQGVALLPKLVMGIAFDEARMRTAISADMHSTDRALELVLEGVPFRDAYVQAASEIPQMLNRRAEDSVKARVSLGGAGNLGLDRLRQRRQQQAPTQPLVVVKVGGDVVADAGQLQGVCDRIAALRSMGHGVVVVHGGGPQVSALQAAMGLTPQKVAGQRVTNAADLRSVVQAICGEVNVALCQALTHVKVQNLGVHAGSGLVRAQRRPPVVVAGHENAVDYGMVGDVAAVDVRTLRALLDAGLVPVVATLALDQATNEVLNVNADDTAAMIAVSMRAHTVLMVTAVGGVRTNATDPTTRIAQLTIAEARALLNNGTISGGMIPKMEEIIGLLEAGIARIAIVAPAGATNDADGVGGDGTVVVR